MAVRLAALAPKALALTKHALERSWATSLDAALEDEDRVRTLRRAVLALPAKYRDAIILFYFHDMDISAAARTLGIPEGTVKSRLHYAKKAMRQLLENKPL